MLDNDSQNQPKPFIMKKGINLVDPGKEPSGTLHLEFIVVCLGRIFKTLYELRPKSSVSGEQDKEREIRVTRFIPPEFLDKTKDVILQEITPEVKKPKAKKPKAKKPKKDKKKK